MPSIAALRHAPWSLSKVKCALRCPLEFHYKYVERIAEPAVEPDARIGKAVHAALESVLGGAPIEPALGAQRNELLNDEERQRYDELGGSVRKFMERIDDFRARHQVHNEFIESRLAVNADLAATSFIAQDAFFRGVWDVGFIYDDARLAVVDHKTGPRRDLRDFTDQLEGYATLAAANHAYVKRVWLGVHFVAEAAMEWTEPLAMEAVRTEYAPKVVDQIEQAAGAVAGAPEPRPSGWCHRCSYRAICPTMRTAKDPGDSGDPAP